MLFNKPMRNKTPRSGEEDQNSLQMIEHPLNTGASYSEPPRPASIPTPPVPETSTRNHMGWSERLASTTPDASLRLSKALARVFEESAGRPIVVVCVGTDRSTGDSFGPIIGTKLLANGGLKGVTVFGSLNEPVHAGNLETVLCAIQTDFPSPLILAVDACLGQFDHVGHIVLERGPLRPGAGVRKALPSFGDYSLTGIVNVGGFMEYFVLQNTRLGTVMQMAEVVARAFRLSFYQFQARQEHVQLR